MKIGIIGAGKISEKHILAYRNIGYDEIKVHDVNYELARETTQRYNAIHVKEQDELISSCDIIDVCTPVTTHKDIILKSLRNGKHVFCEKPLCKNISEAHEIRAAAREANKLVMVGYLYRFHPGFEQVKKWLDSNIIGNIHFGLFRIGGRGNHRKWKHMKESGGGCINEMLIHKLDLILFFIGKIDGVKTLCSKILLRNRYIEDENIEPNAEDNIIIQLKANNAHILCQADFTSPSYMEYLELHGDKGSIFTSILGYFPTLLFLKEPSGIYNQGNNLFKFSQVNLFELELEHFFACIRSGENNTKSVEDSIELIKIIEKIKREE